MPGGAGGPLVRELPPGPVAVIGDVHGEIEALETLLGRLDGRPLVFVGDLVDRGPDSVAVVERVAALVREGRAESILGNHEFNALRGERKHGNRWFFGEEEPDFDSRPATPAEREAIRAFFAERPVALHREDLRVVHAAWCEASLDALRGRTDAVRVHDEAAERVRAELETDGLRAARAQAWARYRDRLRDPDAEVPYLEEIARYDAAFQVRNPIRVLTSGTEAPAGRPFFAAGRWRMVTRTRWWDRHPPGPPVVIGHYWRVPRPRTRRDALDPLDGIPPFAWMGPHRNVFCVDYSVGLRARERRTGERFGTMLAALLVPEWRLVTDTGQEIDLGPPGD